MSDQLVFFYDSSDRSWGVYEDDPVTLESGEYVPAGRVQDGAKARLPGEREFRVCRKAKRVLLNLELVVHGSKEPPRPGDTLNGRVLMGCDLKVVSVEPA